MTPALRFAQNIVTSSTTPFSRLQIKLAFLLSMAAFLRPSDLARIPFNPCRVDTSTGFLHFHVVVPKEKRKGRNIIKPFTVHPNSDNGELCPVRCFAAIRDHPTSRQRLPNSQLFISSKTLTDPIASSTLSTWLYRYFIKLVTSEKGVSIRSIASSRALDLGDSLDDIVTLGNWSSSGTFQYHYQRNNMARVNFTSVVLQEQDEFYDANDDFISGSA
jgi:hypothetical protein